jgi:hypothetical protein
MLGTRWHQEWQDWHFLTSRGTKAAALLLNYCAAVPLCGVYYQCRCPYLLSLSIVLKELKVG